MFKMVFLAASLTCFVVTVPVAASEEFTAKDLASYCSRDLGPESLICVAYTAGFGDGISAGVVSTLEFTKGKVCIPSNINGARARFIADNPDVLAESAKTALTVAMWRAYPCK